MAAIDYNLLRPLRALLEQRNITRAAATLHVSQPTMSTALARLRSHYEDPLLIRRGNEHVLSPLAERLLAMLPQLIAETEQIFRLQSQFDPATSTRTFTIAGVDYAISRVAPVLARIVQDEAPLMRFEFPAVDARLVNGLPDSIRTIDALILPHGYVVDRPHLDLPPEDWVILIDRDRGLGASPTAADLLARPWVQNIAARDGMNPVRTQLQLRGIEIRVAAVTPHFFVVPSLVVGTDRVAVVPRGMAAAALRMHPKLEVVEPPFDLDPVRDALWWLPDREHDAEHAWLRGILTKVVADVI